ncbi:MAG: 30S ribosomal protein S6 [Candidatus Sericytochromatia bacterium]|nr:30S ribosomal protein S6 [Candidatus Sericytochromatia bacterium]
MENRQYEALCILHPHLDEEAVTTAITKFEDTIKNLGGSIEKLEKQGRKKLAYTVKKVDNGYFFLSYFNLGPNKITDLKETCRLSEPMLRHFIARKVG